MSLIVSESLLVLLSFSETHFSLNLKKLKIFILLLFGGAIFYQLVFSNVNSVFFTRIGNMFQAILSNQDVLETVSEGRAFRFNEGLELISSNLAFGYGLELPNGGYPHNLIIESFLSLGIVGGFLFTYIYLYGIFRAVRLIKLNGHVNEIFSYFYIQRCVMALSSGNLYASSIFWYLLFYVLSRSIERKQMNRYNLKN
jgi:O-antigen ligase